MALDVENLAAQMLSAGASAFGENWDKAQTYAKTEFQKMAVTIKGIESDLLQDPPAYTPETAKLLFSMQLQSTENTLIAVTEMVIVAVQAAIRAVLSVIADVVQKALGFDLFAPA